MPHTLLIGVAQRLNGEAQWRGALALLSPQRGKALARIQSARTVG